MSAPVTPTLTPTALELAGPETDLTGQLAAAEMVEMLLDAPTRPARRAAVWAIAALAGLLLFVMAGVGALSRGGVDGDADGCVSGIDAPAPPGRAGTGPAPSAEQRANAAIVVNTGRGMGVPDRGLWVALAAALQESGLRNLASGDRDSMGLFQQRPSQGWGSAAQIADPAYAASQFFRHLLAVPGWATMPLAGAAQAVQRSAFPSAYNHWAPLAATLLAGAGGAPPAPCQSGDVASSGQVMAVLATARAQLGKPYVWGATGPGAYDCSGLTQTAWKAAGVSLPRTAAAQATAGTHIPLNQVQAGDLLFWSYNGQISGIHHVALSMGNGQILEAAETGVPVRVRPVRLPAAGGTEKELMPFGIRPDRPASPA